MTNYRSVNETLNQPEELHGMPVGVEGVLGTWAEGTMNGYELLHYLKVERRTGVPSISFIPQSSPSLKSAKGFRQSLVRPFFNSR